MLRIAHHPVGPYVQFPLILLPAPRHKLVSSLVCRGQQQAKENKTNIQQGFQDHADEEHRAQMQDIHAASGSVTEQYVADAQVPLLFMPNICSDSHPAAAAANARWCWGCQDAQQRCHPSLQAAGCCCLVLLQDARWPGICWLPLFLSADCVWCCCKLRECCWCSSLTRPHKETPVFICCSCCC